MNQTATLIAIDPNALQALTDELARVNRRLDAVQMTAMPEWLTVENYAELIGKTKRTVTRMIDSGKLEVKHTGGIRLIHVNLAA
jgi:excisionase family DNA binding protein